MTVADDMHNRGVGTLLLEHLVSQARGQRLQAFTAETLVENALMLKVFADAGLQVQRALADGVYDLTFPLPTGEADAALGTYRDAVAARERSADVASRRHVLTPASVAVIGASRRPRSVGRAILRNILSGGFPGPVYAVTGRDRTGRRSLRPVGGRPARRHRPGGHCRAGRFCGRYRRGMRGSGGSGRWWCSRRDSAGRPARSCWASAATARWSARPATV